MIHNRINKEKIVNMIQNGIILLFFLGIVFLFLLKSPLHPWNNSDSYADSSVFKTVAMMIDKGHMPYRDSFDHKGPYIYLLNLIGSKISYYRGIWIIEFVNLFVTIVVLYKIARLKCGKIYSVVSAMIAMSLLFISFQGGNLVEEYALPFISVSVYIFIDYFINDRINRKRLVLCGISLSVILFLRPNMIATWVVFCGAVILKCMSKKEMKALSKYIAYFLIGVFSVCIPVFIWLWINGCVGDFWNAYIVFNKAYSTSVGQRATTSNRYASLLHFANNSVVIIGFIVMTHMCIHKKNHIYKIYLIYMIVSLLSICISGMDYDHYASIMVPMLVFPISLLYNEATIVKENSCIVALIVSLHLLSAVVMPNWFELLNTVPKVYKERNEYKVSKVVKEISDVIDSESQESDKISVYGNWDIIYVISNREHAGKYSYQFPIGEVQPSIMDEYYTQLKKEQPIIIVVQSERQDDRILSFINDNGYKIIWQDANSTAQIYKKTVL